MWKTIFSGVVGALLASLALLLFYSRRPIERITVMASEEEAKRALASGGSAHPVPSVEIKRIPRSEADPAPAAMTEAQMNETAERRFDKQTYDAGWARDAQDRLQKKIGAQLPEKSKLLRVECRETLCRVDMEFADQDALRNGLNGLLLGRVVVWDGPVLNYVLSTSADGTCVSRSFFGRPGSLEM